MIHTFNPTRFQRSIMCQRYWTWSQNMLTIWMSHFLLPNIRGHQSING